MAVSSRPREAVIVLLDANETMLEEFGADKADFLGTTKWDVARYITQEIILSSSSSSLHQQQQHPFGPAPLAEVVAVVLLRTTQTCHHFFQEEKLGLESNTTDFHVTNLHVDVAENPLIDDVIRVPSNHDNSATLFPNLTEWPGKDGKLLQRLQNHPRPSSRKRKLCGDGKENESSPRLLSVKDGDFVNGLILGTDTLYRHGEAEVDSCRSTTPIITRRRRMVLLTDGKHKTRVVDHPQPLLVAIDSLKRMQCLLDVVLLRDDDTHETTSDNEEDCCTELPTSDNLVKAGGNTGDDSSSSISSSDDDEEQGDGNSDDDDDESDHDDDDDDEEVIQSQNEALLRNLVEKLGGSVLIPKSMREIVDTIMGRTNKDDSMLTIPIPAGPITEVKKIRCVPVEYDEEAIAPSTIQTNGLRRESSLRSGLGLPIYWNGQDDVPLREWLQRIKPSHYNNDGCPWIQVKNINRDSPGHFQNRNDDDNTDDDDNEDVLDTEQISRFAKYKAPLNEITKTIEAGRNVSKAAKEKCVKEIMRLAQRDKETVGKWLLYVSPAQADEVWENIARATALGYLGCSSKIAPTANKQDRPTVVCVYVRDSTDKREVQRVLKTLYYDLKITSGLSSFKPDIFTYLDIYAHNRWRLKPTLYSWKEAIAWKMEERS